jgi:PAS domain S-box-containing protein
LSQSIVASQSAPPRLHFRVPPEPSHLLRARERLRDYLRQFCMDGRVIDDVVLCVEEAATDAIRHSGSDHDIAISLGFAGGDLVAKVQDHGRGFDVGSFDPDTQPDPLIDHGRGLFIIAKLMDALELRSNGGLEVRMTRRAQPRCGPATLESGLDESRAGSRLSQREGRVRAMLEEIDEAFVALDWEYRYVHVNEAMLRFTQTSRDELLGRVIWDAFPQLQGSPVQERYRRAMELGIPSVFEHRAVVTGDWLEIRIYPTSVGVSAYYREINKRKQAAARLREGQELLHAVMEGSPDPIFVKDRESRILLGNAALLDIWGKPADEVIGKTDRELYADPAIAEAVIENDRAVMTSGQSQALEETVQTKDGLRTYLSTKTPYRNGKGEIVGVLGIARDITERKQAEEALRDSRAELEAAVAQRQLALDAAKLGWWHYDPQTNVSWYDEGYRQIFDVTGSERPNDEILERLHPDDLPGVWAKVEAALDAADPRPYAAEYRIYVSDGSLRWVEAHGVAAFEGEGRERHAISLVGTVQDVTERKQGDQARQGLLEESQTQAEELEIQSEELRVQGEELRVRYDAELAQRAAILRENELRAGLNAIGELLHSSLEPDEVMQRALGEATRALGIDAAAVELREGDAWPIRYAEGLPAEATGSPLLGEPVVARLVANSGAVLVLDDVTSHETVGPVATRGGIRSLVAVPLVARDESVGVLLLVERRATHHFELAEVDFARRLGTSIGLALENARLFSSVLETSGHLGNVLQGMADGFVSVDREWRYTLVNPQAERLIGRPAGELLGRSMEGLFPDMEGWPRYRTAMSERRPEIFEVWSKPLETWLEVHAYPTPDGLSVLFSDITARKAAAEELRLHNADLAERAHFADSLNAINRLLHATLDFDTIMQGALDEGAEALGATAGLVEMREGPQWVVRYQHGLAEADVGIRLSAAAAPIATRIEARGEPLAFADVQDDGSVDTGFLRTHALRSALAVPLVARAAVIGCLTFYGAAVRVFSDAEVDFARKLGATVSLALENARLYEEQQRIAQTLQENFIHELPTVAGLELGVVSRTAHEPDLVGGDFSDVFLADDTHVVALIGDVAGKGVRAAGLTETVRSTVRALAVTDSSPASILAKANELLLRFDPDEPHVTVFLAVLDPHTGHLNYASAGHPAPVHVGAFTCGGLDVTFGPPLGTFQRAYENGHAMLTLDDYLVLYTDGVTEARRDGALLGEQRLLEIVEGLRGHSAQEVAEGVRDAASDFAHGRLSDDLQVVVLRLA